MLALKVTLTALLLSLTTTSAEIPPFDSWPSRRIKLPDVSIHLKHHGSGPPLVLLHGQPQHSLTWHTIAPLLAQEYTVIVPDGRGAGASGIPYPEKYTAEALANDVDGILTALGVTGKAFSRLRPRGRSCRSILPHAPRESRSISSVGICASRLRIRGIHGSGRTWLVEQSLALIPTHGPRRCDVLGARSGTAVFTVVLLARGLLRIGG